KGRTKLIRRDRLILTRTNPGIDHIAQPALLKFVHQPAQSFQQPAVSLIGCGLGPLSGRTFFAASSKQSARRKEARRARINGFPMPPGTAFWITSSELAIVFLLVVTGAIFRFARSRPAGH